MRTTSAWAPVPTRGSAMLNSPFRRGLPAINWLQVLGTAERSQIYQHVRHQLHAIVPLLDAFKPQQQPLERIFPRKGPLHAHPQCMDGFVEEAFASAHGCP